MINNFRFVDEYANFKRRQAKKDCKLFCSFDHTKEEKEEFRRECDKKLKDIDGIVNALHRGLITLDEGMGQLAEV